MALFLLFILAALILAYLGGEAIAWSLLLTIGILLYSLIDPSLMGLLVLWAAYIAAITLLNLPDIRKQYLTTRIFDWVRKVLPGLSDTEKEAIAAGTVSWDGELFSGLPNWHHLLNLPKPELSESEKAFINGPVNDLCTRLNDWEITHERYDLPPEIWQFIKDNGFFGMIVPKKYGGLELSALAHSTAVMKIATRSITAAVTVMVPNSLGPAELLMHYGTQKQRDYYLPRLAKGQEIPCFALTGPQAGSDAGAIPDTGIVCKGEWEGKEVIGLRLNWNKRYITLAPVATILGLAFKVYDPDKLLSDVVDRGVTCALIPTNTPGVQTGARHLPLNTVFMNGPTWGKDVFVPLDYLIGGEDFIGKGWMMLMNCLAVGRAISLPALATGAGKLSSLTSGAYARIREQFGLPIGFFEGVKEALAPIGGLTYIMDSARCLTAGLLDQGEKPSVPSAILKYHNTEKMRKVVGHAMDIHAGRGVIKGPRNYIARVYQAIPISITVEGANILTRSLMIFGQGSIRSHPYLLSEMEAVQMEDREKGLQAFDHVFFKHIHRNVQLTGKSLMLGLTGSLIAEVPEHHPSTKRYFQHLTRFAAAFALLSDVTLMALGGDLKRREKTSARLGDCLSYLYLASTVIKRFHDDQCPREDVPLLDWSVKHCLYNIQQALHETLKNYPSPLLAIFMRTVIFPLGRHMEPADDLTEDAIAELLLRPSVARDRLVDGVYRSTQPDDPIGRVENAFLLKTAAESAEKTLKQALKDNRLDENLPLEELLQQARELKILTESESKKIAEAAAAVDDAIQVDHFHPEELPITQSD
ncbi:acyl-CoA dehydrogenase [Hahella sp. CCB-MM4]|uniref:acyl-CoA dehydrogenase n=1 Tax=Hahella sp. (strain CCB-MM4) TaxID=1926491 RepID=UPI000B9B1486|nr:acyl-CoA dehydrogenase [Hahella sp. CCB-MM4]OZG70719.1 acyl-CoA dehydrogenase [Hahella sp. CCB-MM4]